MLALAARIQQSLPVQQGQVAGHQGLRDVQNGHQLTNEELTLPQQQKQPQAVLIGQGAQYTYRPYHINILTYDIMFVNCHLNFR